MGKDYKAIMFVRPAALIRWVLGLLLLTAAALKGHALATGPLVAAGWLGNRWLMAGAVEAEAALGLWLLGGAAPAAACLAAGGCFFFFAVFSLRLGLAGAHSCGCFGRLPVNPWITLALDLAALPAALWAARREMRNAECGMRNEDMLDEAPAFPLRGFLCTLRTPIGQLLVFLRKFFAALCASLRTFALRIIFNPHSALRNPQSAIIIALFFLIGSAGFLKMTLYHAADKADRKLTLLDSRQWLGRRWPIGGHVEGWPRLSRGKWAVLLFAWPCGHCGQTVAAYAELAAQWESLGADRRVALIDTGGDAVPEEIEARLASSPALRGRLVGPPEWFIVSPTLVVLDEGRVTAVAEGDEDCQWDEARLDKN